MKEMQKARVRAFAIRSILAALVVLIISLFPANFVRSDSEQDDLKQKNQELERRLNEEIAANNLTKAKYQILEEKFTQLLFDSPNEIQLKAYYARRLEEEFRVRLFDGSIPWDTHEAYAVLRIFENFPKEVREYFLQGANPVLTMRIENPGSMVTEDGKTAYGLYDPCHHTIFLNRNVLRGSWFAFPSEIRVHETITHELGHAYDRSRALVELKGAFNCTVSTRAFYSLYTAEYRKIVEGGGNIYGMVVFTDQEKLVFENFAETFARYMMHDKREDFPSRATAQYDFFYSEVFCKATKSHPLCGT